MSERPHRVLNFGALHRYASPMLARLGHEFLKTVSATGVFALWRRVPITTVTITLVIGFWLYDYVSVSSAATASAPRPSVAAQSVAPMAIQPVTENHPAETRNESRKRTRRPHRGKTSHAAFRRKRIGQNEVDYVANDVTIRLFTPGSPPMLAAHSSRQRHIEKDVTARNFKSEPGRMPKRVPGSTMTQAAERSALVSK